MLLIALFFVLVGIDLLLLLKRPATCDPSVTAAFAGRTIWTAVLMAGIWRRQNWCRYILITLLLLGIIIAIVSFPAIFVFAKFVESRSLIPLIMFALVGDGVVALTLMYSKDIRRLARYHD